MRKYLAGALFGLSMLAGGISVQAAGVTGESSDIKSLSVGSGTLSAGDSQKVTIGLDSSIQADEALLEVYNETIDYKSVYYATANEAGQLEFDFEIPEEGTYSITGLKLVDDGNTYEYSLSDLGLTQEFCASGDTDDDTDYDDDENVYKAGSGLVVVIDAGHGGYDGGAESTFNGVTYSEKYMNLKIAQACRDELQKYYGVTVYMTRDDDTFVKLEDRTAYAKSVGADVFVSIHNNSSESGAANGATVFYPNSNYNASIGSTGQGLAQSILNNLTQFGLKNNGVQIRNSESGDTYADGSLCDYYSVIRGSKKRGFPGLIVEHAFLSNQSDAENYLNSDAKLTALGVADAKGIAAYYGLSVGTGQLERQENGDWYMMHNGQIDTNYNSLAYYQGYWYVVSNGVLNRNFTGLYKYQGNWYYAKNGTVDFHYTGLAKNSAGWFYVDDGKINWNYNGLAKGDAGWFYVRSGKVDFSKNGLVYNAGNWFYIQNGYLNWNTTTLVKYNGRWYGVHNGYVDWNYSGIIRLGGSYYYVSNGILNWNYTGLAKNETGWFYVKNGKVDFSKTGLVYNAGNWFYIQNGILNWNYAGLAKNDTGWFYVKQGKVDFSKVGLVYNAGNWFWITNGFLNWNSNGVVPYAGKWFCVRNGRVDWSYNGLAVGTTGTWYIKNGQVDFTYNGPAVLNGDEYIVYGGHASVKGTSIMGTSSTSVEQMVKYYNAHATYPAFYAGTDAPTIAAFCQIYMEECAAEGVKAEVAFCQAMNETGFLKFGGQVSITQYNFAGMGATDDGAAGASFPNVRTGVRAQVQHLKGYASTNALNNACVDPRFAYLSKSRGCAPIVEWLGINENPAKKGWATSVNYGYNLRNLYMNKLAQY